MAVTNSSRSKRPYLIRAMHEWMVDNDNTPHIVVDAGADGVMVPVEHIKDGKIILNISDTAAHNLKLGNDAVSFRARFGGIPFDVWVPMPAIMGIYARETGQGMIFSHDSDTMEPTGHDEVDSAGSRLEDDLEGSRARSHLRVIK